MRMEGNDDVLPIVQVSAHVFNLVGIHMRHGHFHGGRQIDDDLFLCRRLPDIDNLVADLCSEIHFRTGKAFRRIFEAEVRFRILFCIFFYENRAVLGDLNNLFL